MVIHPFLHSTDLNIASILYTGYTLELHCLPDLEAWSGLLPISALRFFGQERTPF